ncbi:MAG: phosphoserine phosphatase SerB [Alphaproteobacteria bacterium]
MAYVLTLIAPEGSILTPPEHVTRGATHQLWLEEGRALDLFFDMPPALPELQGIDAVLQPVKGSEKKLLISDMDSTMIAQECIDELADLVGKKPHVAAITERAMNGELDFKAALSERVALLKGLTTADLARVMAERITLMPGAKTLIATMKARGCHTVLVSGGFTFFTARVAAATGFHEDHANHLDMENDHLTGKVVEPILDKESKLHLLQHIAAQKNLTLQETLAIGDGANDLPMLNAAGLGVAYHAKKMVQQQVTARINHNDLSALLLVQGIAPEHWQQQ